MFQEISTASGFDEALIGIGQRCGQPDIAVYSVPKVLEILMNRDGLTNEEAQEFFEFNIGGAWVGAATPIWMWPCDPTDLVVH